MNNVLNIFFWRKIPPNHLATPPRTLYARHILARQVVGRDTRNDRPRFDSADHFPDGLDVDRCYTRARQQVAIGKQVGSFHLASSKYVPDSGDVFLARGHLAPNADFVYYAFQDATFYFVNVAPQWQSFNGGNWARLEGQVRRVVERQQRSLLVYTGTSGVMELDDTFGEKVQVYLHPHPDGNRLPVPRCVQGLLHRNFLKLFFFFTKSLPCVRFFWKLVLDPSEHSAVGLVGVNNPHLTREESLSGAYHVCGRDNELVSHRLLESIGARRDDVSEGVVYACRYRHLKEAFPEVPDLGKPSLLIL